MIFFLSFFFVSALLIWWIHYDITNPPSRKLGENSTLKLMGSYSILEVKTKTQAVTFRTEKCAPKDDDTVRVEWGIESIDMILSFRYELDLSMRDPTQKETIAALERRNWGWPILDGEIS